MATMSQTKVHTSEGSETDAPSSARVVLKLRKPATKNRRQVAWTEGTVDNEHMNRRKSKCCCVYVKPRKFGESSSSSEDEACEHCRGHVERRQRNKKPAAPAGTVTTASAGTMAEGAEEAAAGAPPASRRHVAWAADTVDNENMNKRKSKCCCIFEKRHEFGESSSDSEADDCPNCRGHKEVRSKKNANDAAEPLLASQFMVHGDAS
ncbi:uncharacterized protein [Dermacentor andersoni]|uniref:uncharacterized protein n=1 Tax=Dermacentor andersoni TaxID=34620 RepID=UPI003B3B4990